MDDGRRQLDGLRELMTIGTSLRLGARGVASNKKLLLVYYALNLAAAAIVISPVAMLLTTLLGHSLESERLFTNLDPEWLMETGLRFDFAPAAGLLPIALLAGFLYLLANTFLAGGAIAMLHRRGESFFAACARYFPRFFRIFLISILFYGVAFAIVRGLLPVESRWSEQSMREAPGDMMLWGIRAFQILLFFAVNMIFDYAKIVCVVEDRKALRATWRALGFTLRNFGSTYGLFLVTAAAGIAFLAIYHGLSEWFGQNSIVAIAAVFLIRQVYILARFCVRLWTWGSEIALFSGWPKSELPG
jgi:hypothetical protein